MRFWSEGLGDSELVMGLDRAKLERRGDLVLLTGIVDSPAPWEYEVKVQFDDWIVILHTATSKDACDFSTSHMDLVALADMARSIVKFVLLLAAYRLVHILGLGHIYVAPINGLEGKRSGRH